MEIAKRLGRKAGEYIKTLDKWILLLCLVLSGASIFYLYGLYYMGSMESGRIVTQTVAVIIGLVAALVMAGIDYKLLTKLWKVYLPLCVIGVILTFFVGSSRGDNQAWLIFNIMGRSFSLQPSEFLKISFITTFATHLEHVGRDINKIKNVILLCLHGGAHILLIVIQRDDGTAIVFFGIFAIMLFIAGLSYKYIIPGLAVVAAAIPVLWFKVMSGDQKMRFLVLKDPAISDRYAYQQQQGLKAMGLGGIGGTGFLGPVVHVPENYNDFIFTFIGQTTGLIGCLAVIVVLVMLCYKLIFNANRSPDIKGRMICMGLMAMIVVQSVMNIGMCLNLMPVIGVPLPFLSAGGSSVVAIYLGVGFALSVHRHSKKDLFR